MLPYSPLHHLLLADAGTPLVMTSGNVSDEPIAYRDDDALERLRGIADLFLLHDRPIQTRTDDSVVRAVPRRAVLRRSRGYVPGGAGTARRGHAPAAARLRRRAQEHLLPGQGDARLGQPPHRRPRELRDASLVHRGDRALPAAVRGRAGGRRPRPAPRVPVDQVRARARRRRADRRPAPPRPPRRLPGRARGGRARDRRDLRRDRVRARRDGVGRRAPVRRRGLVPPCRRAAAGRVARRRARRSSSPGAWRARGCRRPAAASRSCRARCRAGSTRAPGRRCAP